MTKYYKKNGTKNTKPDLTPHLLGLIPMSYDLSEYKKNILLD